MGAAETRERRAEKKVIAFKDTNISIFLD